MRKPKVIILNCPECRAPAYFETDANVTEEDAKAIIEMDARACRWCGAALLPLRDIILGAIAER